MTLFTIVDIALNVVGISLAACCLYGMYISFRILIADRTRYDAVKTRSGSFQAGLLGASNDVAQSEHDGSTACGMSYNRRKKRFNLQSQPSPDLVDDMLR